MYRIANATPHVYASNKPPAKAIPAMPVAPTADAADGLENLGSADDSGPTAIGTIGRAYDLIVLPQPGALPKMPESVFETALFDSGRPVLVVPTGVDGLVGKRILFAWNGSTESARAISLAMPVLSGLASAWPAVSKRRSSNVPK